MTIYGAYNPPLLQPAGTIEHIFARSDNLVWVPDAIDGIRERDRVPLVTIEPWSGIGDTIAFVRRLTGDPLWLRYGHEFNGNWYPWSSDPMQLKRDWMAIKEATPDNVRLIWCPNIIYAGSRPLAHFWVEGAFDVLGLDGYDQIDGMEPKSFIELFHFSSIVVRRFAPTLPLWICETAHPRRYAERPTGAGQAGWINDLRHNAPRFGVDAVVWFNQDKDDGKWALGPAGVRAFFGGAR